MQNILEQVKEFCRTNEIHFQEADEVTALCIGFRGRHGAFRSFLRTDEAKRILRMETLFPVNVPEEHRGRMVELAAWINRGVLIGHLSYDPGEGLLIYKTGLIFGESADGEVIRHQILGNWANADRFFPAVSAVLYADATPEDAFHRLAEAPVQATAKESKSPDARPKGGRLSGLWADN